MRIYLTGFMGSGKTTVGRILAHQLQYAFYDLDEEIERKLKQSVTEVFGHSGEAEFRNQEKITLEETARSEENAVIATGGGCFIHHADFMLQNGKVILLDVPFEILAQRIGADPSRPLWKNASRLFAERQSHYQKAHLVIDGTGTAEEIARRIRNALNQ